MKLNYTKLDMLAETYGDSFYLTDSGLFENNYRELLFAFKKFYPETQIAYSYKTNYTPELCRTVNRLGGAAEIVSEMELWLAQQIGVPDHMIYYNGPYKKAEFIEEVLTNGGHVNLDADFEIEIINDIACKYPEREFGVGLRCNMDIGQEVPSRFGFDVSAGALKDALNRINAIDHVHANGLHCHIPFRTLDSYVKRMDVLREILDQFPRYKWDYISLGGGYMGRVSELIARQLSYEPPSFEDYASVVAGGMKTLFEGKERPVLVIEPGSALAANVVKYVTRVISIKTVRDKQIATLTGSSYQINPSVRDVRRPVSVYYTENGKERKKYEHLDMAGYTCIESDYLYRDYCGELVEGDFVVFDNVGSYSVVMKPPFILPDIPMLELMENGNVNVLKQAQKPEDVFRNFN